MDDRSKSAPPWRLKLFCWVLLAMFSAVLAEVPAGSSPMLLYHPWGLLVVTPLYGLHLLFFATIVYRWGRPTFFTLFFAGALFGLYEAYITKVLWNPTWTGDYHHLAGLVVEPTLMMTLFWHNWMAFILPLAAGEWLLTRSRTVLDGLPAPLRRWLARPGRPAWLLAGGGLIFGLFVSAQLTPPKSLRLPSPLYAALALALNATILLGFTWLWRRHGRGHRYILAELLPGRRGFVVLTMLLALFYLVTGLTLRPEIVPSLGPQVSIWILYLVYGWLLVIHMRRSRRFPAEDAAAPASGDLPPSPWPLVGLVVVTFITAAVVTRVILPGSMIFLQAGWLIGILSGVGLFVAGVWQAMRA